MECGDVREKLQAIEDKYRELESLLGDPDTLADVARWRRVSQEHAQLLPVVEKFRTYKDVMAELAENTELLNEGPEDDLRRMLLEEISVLKERQADLEKEFPLLLLPKDPNDDKNVIVEIRGGVGGEEAALFAGDLFRMYTRYAEKRGWRTTLLNSNPTELGGFKEVAFSVEGYGAFSRLKYERGTHRVQRVPETESSGRIHTSAVTVAVLPEAEEVEVNLRPEELRIDTYCAHGAGGQYVNRTETAVRITHLPTGIVVQCQDEKSQLKNKEQALRVLRARILERAEEEQAAATAADRRHQVGSGDRSQRIRTYNFPQGRVTDHRVGLTLHKLSAVLDGELDELLDVLITADQAERLRQQ